MVEELWLLTNYIHRYVELTKWPLTYTANWMLLHKLKVKLWRLKPLDKFESVKHGQMHEWRLISISWASIRAKDKIVKTESSPKLKSGNQVPRAIWIPNTEVWTGTDSIMQGTTTKIYLDHKIQNPLWCWWYVFLNCFLFLVVCKKAKKVNI